MSASFEPSVSVSEVARAVGLHVSQLFRWRKLLCEQVVSPAMVPALVPVAIASTSLLTQTEAEPNRPFSKARPVIKARPVSGFACPATDASRKSSARRSGSRPSCIVAITPRTGSRGRPVDPSTPSMSDGIGLDQATIDGKALATDQPFGDAAGEHTLEQAAQEIAVAEAAVTILRKGRMVRYAALQAKPAEPAVGGTDVDLAAEPAHRADAGAVADDQHTDHQLRTDRGTARGGVERCQFLMQAGEIDEVVDARRS